jgi:glycosyltransferase involved in cell wall biosynthesis
MEWYGQMTRFSIVATDYEPYVPRDRMLEGLNSLNAQTFKDFELIIVHDGSKPTSEHEYDDASIDFKYFETDKHYGIYGTEEFYAGYGWGHHSRDLGMSKAEGEYIINFNIDNILYPNALEKINNKLEKTKADVLVFACTHEKFHIKYFSGIPPVMGKVDMLQCVVSRKAWDSIGGWYRYDHSADGFLLEELIKRYGYVHLDEVLGDNR